MPLKLNDYDLYRSPFERDALYIVILIFIPRSALHGQSEAYVCAYVKILTYTRTHQWIFSTLLVFPSALASLSLSSPLSQ